MNITQNYSDYIVYVDESGDLGMGKIDPGYPVFALAFCIFKKTDYLQSVIPALNSLKSEFWGHCDVVLHERDIRKKVTGDWSILKDPQIRKVFMNNFSKLIKTNPFNLIACVIQKQKMTHHQKSENLYNLAMLSCMESLNDWLLEKGQSGTIVQIQCEARGRVEDNKLELAFRRICSPNPHLVASATDFSQISYRIRFLNKISNSTGLQIADMVARPIGIHTLRPKQRNRAFESIKGRFITHANGNYEGRGLRLFPT